MNNDEINDKRTIEEFRSVTFSEYSRSKVKKILLESLIKGEIEPACYWSAELICSGLYQDIWEIIILYTSRYIYVSNPRLPLYIELRLESFREIINNGFSENILKLRNNEKIRKLFAELISMLCYSKKRHAFESLNIKDKEEFNIAKLTTKLKAPKVDYAKNSFKKDDPRELLICINEFAYHISKDSKDIIQACYWIEWLIEYENICKSKKIKCQCERRIFASVDNKFQMEIIWMIWDAILCESEKRDKNINKIIKSLLNLFCIKYSSGCKKRRKYILYFACNLLTEKVDISIPIIQEKQKIEIIVNKINIIYREIKKCEIKPDTDYLFNGLEKNNIEKTIEKIDKMNEMMNI